VSAATVIAPGGCEPVGDSPERRIEILAERESGFRFGLHPVEPIGLGRAHA
jgi:hypothetical protein